ncbi:EAL domain-containing protein [Rhodoferax sp.]|uniref:sensor domain-containing protein n=1 Tax=Rhodoferax sp. TaxID=50421 RepID=UPI00374DE5BA
MDRPDALIDADAHFRQFTQLAAQLCQAPIATLTLVDPLGHRVAAHTGADAIKPALLQQWAAQLPPSSSLQTVDAGGHFHFCTATPVWTPAGGLAAVLWVMDPQPRTLDAAQAAALASLAEQVQVLLQAQLSEQQYRRLFDDNPLPMWVQAASSQRILAVNSAAIEHYGYSEAEFLALPSYAALHAQGHRLSETGTAEDPVFWEVARHRSKYGRGMEVELSTRPMLFNGQPARMVMVYDITMRLDSERELARLRRAQRMLTACNEALVRTVSEAALLEAVCQIAVEMGGYTTAWIGFAEHDAAKTIRAAAHVGAHGRELNSWPFSWSVDAPTGQGPAGRTVRSGALVFVPDLSQDRSFDAWLAQNPVPRPHSAVCLPLRNGSETFGVYYLSASEAQEIGKDELELLQQLANDIAFGIDHLRAQAVQREADARIRDQASLLDKAQDAIVVRGIDHRVLYWNKSAERLYGWTAAEVLGQSVVARLYPNPATFAAAIRAVMEQGEWNGEIQQQRKDGSQMVVEARWTLVRDAQDQPHSVMAVNTDVTQRKVAEREVQKLAFYDPLTQLPNRQLLMDRLTHAVATSQRNGQGGALLYIDLDYFKTLNDTLGHAQGDLLLQQVAQRLCSSVRQADTVGRLGGDEFVVILEDLAPDARGTGVLAKHIAEKVLLALGAPYLLDSQEHRSTCSIGIAPYGREADTVGELLKQAGIAMQQAKDAGRNTAVFFDPQLQAEVIARAALEADLRLAVARDEFFLHYQSQHDVQGRMTGVEALVRWRHAQRGMVSPAAFIPLAEETGLILEIGQRVLSQACTLLAQWGQRAETRHLTMAVNVSSRQFKHADFVQQVMDTLAATGAQPGQLKLELTESLLVDDIEQTIARMETLKARGVGFSLDDFGTGYSSLSYLKRLPLDQLKIDQSFVRDVMTDPNDAVIARTIIGLGQSLGLNVIAEGVETAEQRDFLAEHGCPAFQGYLFARPVPGDQLPLP